MPDVSNSPRVTRLVKIEADPATGYRTALVDSEEILLDAGLVDNFHAAGAIRFGSDGALYFTHGDGQAVGTSSGVEKAELLSSLDNSFGKMFRINPLTGQGYADNPFFNGDLNSIESKVYNYGLRNPWRYALHPDTDEPFIGDVGQATWEEINRGTGEFFGWSLYEGGNGVNSRAETSGAFNDLYDAFEGIATPPVYAENHADGARAMVVGDFYTGTALPEIYQGALFFADFGLNEVKALVFDEQGNLDSAIPFADFSGRGLSYMSMGPDGNLYFADILDGEIGYFVDASSPNTSPNAVNDAFSTGENSVFTTGSVLANDNDPNGDSIAVSSVNTNTTQGVVTNNNNGTFNYDPNGAFDFLNTGETDTDSFSYTISDGNGGFDTAIVTVTIEGVDDNSSSPAFTIEAEDIATVTSYRLENNGNASGGSMLSLLGVAPNEIGSASFTFTGATGSYDVVLGSFDESDGVASLEVSVNETSIGTVVLDENPAGNGVAGNTKVERLLAAASLSTGDSITITGVENGGEHVRFDFIRFEPTGPVIPTVSITSTAEGAEPATSGEFTVSLTQSVSTDTAISYSVSGSATADADYTALSGSVIIPQGQTEVTIALPVLDDVDVEDVEDVVVTLNEVTGSDAILGAITAATTLIKDDDSAITNEVTLSTTIVNANEPSIDGEFTVSLAAAAATDTAVSYSVGGTATADTDYIALSGTVTILAGETSAIVTVFVLDDADIEGTEDVVVTLNTITSGDADVVLGTTTAATVTITDNDQTASVITVEAESIVDTSIYRIENNKNASGDSLLSLGGVAPNETGTATFNFTGATGNYNIVLGSFDENDGDPAASLSVSVNGSSIGTVVLDENLGGSGAGLATKVERLLAGASLSTGDTITVTGVESGGEQARFDFIRFESIASSVPEVLISASQDGSEPTVPSEFTVSLSQIASSDTVVSYSVSGSATAGSDYTALTGEVTILAGQTTATIDVSVLDDTGHRRYGGCDYNACC